MNGIDLFERGQEEEAYPLLADEAEKENPPGLATLYLCCLKAKRHSDPTFLNRISKRELWEVDNDLINQCKGGTLFDIGIKDQGLALMRDAVKENCSVQNMTVLASRLDRNNPDQRDEAFKLYFKILELDERNQSALLNIGLLYHVIGDDVNAERYLRASVEYDPEDPYAHYELAGYLARRRVLYEALGEYEEAVNKEYPEKEYPYSGLGYCLKEISSLFLNASYHIAMEAREYFSKALQHAPDYDYATQNLAELDALAEHLKSCTEVDTSKQSIDDLFEEIEKQGMYAKKDRDKDHSS